MLMMTPPSPCSTMRRAAAWPQRKGPFRFVRSTRSKSASARSRKSATWVMPALLESLGQTPATKIGAAGLPQTALDAPLSVTETALKRLREDDASGRLPLLHMPRTTDDLDGIRAAATRLREGASDVVFLGT